MGYPKDKKPKKTYTLSTFAKKELRKQELTANNSLVEVSNNGINDNPAVNDTSNNGSPSNFFNQKRPNRYGFETEIPDNTNTVNIQQPITEDQNFKNMNPAEKSAKVVKDKRMVGMNNDGTPKTVTVETTTPQPKLALQDYSSELDKNGNIVLPEKRIDNSIQNRVKTATYNALKGTGIENTGMGDVLSSVMTPIFTGLEQMQRGNKETKFGREIIDNVLGLANIGIGLIPGMVGVNAVSPFITALTGDVAEGMGIKREEGEKVGHLLSLAPFGSKIMLAGLFSNSAGEFVSELIKNKDLDETDKERIVETASQVGFFTGLGAISGGKFLYKNIRNRLDLTGFDINKITPKEIDNAISQEIQLDNTRAIITTLEKDKQSLQKQINEAQTPEERLKSINLLENVDNKINEYNQKTETEKKPYESPATIIGEQPKESPKIDLGNKKQTFEKIVTEFDKELQGIEQKLSSGDITKQEFDELEKKYNETESRKKSWQKRIDDLKEEPKPIKTVVENKRPNNDELYSDENIKNPKYPDRTNEVVEPVKTEEPIPETKQVEKPIESTVEGDIPVQRQLKNEDVVIDKVVDEEYSSTQVNIPESEKKPFIDFANSIPEKDLYNDKEGNKGAETEPHITTLYGLHAGDSKQVEKLLKDFGDVEVILGKTSLFENDKYDVLKVDVNSPQLHDINKKLKDNVDYTSDFPKYEPHLTIAYLKKGEGKKYVGDNRFEGKKIKISELLFSNKNRDKTTIKLSKPKVNLESAKDTFKPEIKLKVIESNKKSSTAEPVEDLLKANHNLETATPDKSALNKSGTESKVKSLEQNNSDFEQGEINLSNKGETIKYVSKTAAAKDVEKVNYPDSFDYKEKVFPVNSMVEDIFSQLGIDFTRNRASSTNSTYYQIELKNGKNFKLRVSDHEKPSLNRTGDSDASISYGKETTPIDIINELRQILPDDMVVKKSFKLKEVEAKIESTVESNIPDQRQVKNEEVSPPDFSNPNLQKLKDEASKLTYDEFKNEYEYLFDQKPFNFFKGSVKEFYDIANKDSFKPEIKLKVEAQPEAVSKEKVIEKMISSEKSLQTEKPVNTVENKEVKISNESLSQKKETRKKQLVEKKVAKMTEQEKKTEGALTDIFAYRERVNGLRRSDISGRANRRKNINALKKAVDEFNTYSPDKTAKIEKGKSGNYKITIDGKPLREERARKEFDVKKEVDNVDNPEANKPFTELGAEERATQIAIAEDLSNVGTKFLKEKGKFETPAKVLKKGIEDIKDDHGKELTPEAIITRDEMLQKSNKENYKERADEILNKADDSDIPADADTSFNFGENVKKKTKYNNAKQIIKDALKKDSGISFGGLSKLGDLADPKVLKAVYDVGKYHYENGAKNIREFTNRVVDDLGEWIKPHLKELWKKAKEEPLANKNAKKYFGTTNFINETGYITPKGELLDLSGKNQGGKPFTRSLDHREINQASKGLTDMMEFIDLGNVRFMPESSTFDILKPLTRKQEKVMTAIIRHYKGDVAIEVQNGKGEYRPDYQMHVNPGKELGKVYQKGTSPKVVFDDIKKFFEEEGAFKKKETDYQNALKSLQEKINRPNMTFGLDTLPEVYKIAKYHTGNFIEWSKKVIKDAGNWIKPHLRNLWNELNKDRTGLDAVTQGFPLSFKKKTEIIKDNIEKPQTEVRDVSEILPTAKNKRVILASDIFTKGDKQAGKDVFNYDNFTESAQINELIKETATDNKKKVDEQKRDVRTWAKTQEGADVLRSIGLDENAFLKMTKGDSLLAERIVAGKDIVNIAGKNLLDRIKNLPEGADAKTALANDYLKYVALVKNLKGLISESGRALNIARKKSSEDVKVKIDLADELIKAGFDTANLPDFANKALEIFEPTYKDKFYYWWYNSMLSSPLTDVANITGNFSHFGFELMRTAVSQSPKDSMQMLRDMKEAHSEGVKQVKDIVKNGETADSKFDYNDRRYGEAFQPASKTGKRIKAILPTTRLAFEDAYFRNMFGAIRKNATLKEIARETGDPIATVENLIKAVAREPDLALLDKKFEVYQKHLNALERFIDYGVFQTPLGEAGRSLQSGVNKLPPVKLIFPFIKIAVNIAKAGVKATPYGLKDLITRKDLTRLEKKDIISRAVTGSAFLAGLGYLISQDLIEVTGHGIDDKDKRELWHKQGYKENHFYMKINGEKYGFSYQNINPINIPLSIIGNLQDDAKYNRKKKEFDDSATTRIIKSLLGMAETLTDQSFMQGISNLMRYIRDKDVEGLYKNAQNLFTPNILSLPRDIRNMTGDGKTLYETNDIESRFKDKIGMTEGLKPKLNQFGEKTKSTYERFPFMVSKQKSDDKLTDFLAENNIQISFPSKQTKLGDQTLSDSPETYYKYNKLSGERFKEELTKQLPELEKLKTAEEKDDAVHKIVNDVRKQIRKEMLGLPEEDKKKTKKHLNIPGRPNPDKESEKNTERNSDDKKTIKKHLIIPK